MQQFTLIEPGKIEIIDVPDPEPIRGQVLVKVKAALTCGTDLKAYDRGHSFIPMPGPFGHEYSGTVIKTGKDVRSFKEGDHVMGTHSAPCMLCPYCKKGMHNLCDTIMDQKVLGAFAEHILLPSHIVNQNLFHKPDTISFEEAAMLEPYSCVVHPYSRLNLDDIETALVIGAGPIGLMHLAYLNMKGIQVIVSDFFDDRLSLASKMGAYKTTVPVNTLDIVNEATSRLGVDLVIECSGQVNVWETSAQYLRRGGTLVLFGGCPSGTSVSYDTHRLHYDELTLIGSFHYTPADVQKAYQNITERKIDLSPLISGEFPLKDLEKALILLREGKGLKYVLKP